MASNRLTVDVVQRAQMYNDPLREHELNLRGYKAPAIENLDILADRFVRIDLSFNEIKKLENLPRLRCLRMLLLTNNHVSEIGEGLAESLSNLEVLGLAGNCVTQLAEVKRLAGLTKLNTLTLAGNPVARCRYYRQYIIHKLPQLRVLDDCEIRAHDRDAATMLFSSMVGREIDRDKVMEDVNESLIADPERATNEATSASVVFTPLLITQQSAASLTCFSNEEHEAVGHAVMNYIRANYSKQPCHVLSFGGASYVQELLDSTNDQYFLNRARMSRPTFLKLLRTLKHTRKLSSTKVLSGAEKLFMFLRVLAGWSNADVADRFQHSGATVTDAVEEVLLAVEAIRQDLMQSPQPETPPEIASSERFFPYFQDCIGAFDGTYIPAIVPAAITDRFRNRKGFISQNVFVACKFDMTFTCVHAGWEGSAHDGTVLADAVRCGFTTPPGKHYLADQGYPVSPHVLVPYRGQRYGLREDGVVNMRPLTDKELFNLRHASLRNVIERAFGCVKKKFPLLQTMRSYEFPKQVRLVVAAFVIFNSIRLAGEDVHACLSSCGDGEARSHGDDATGVDEEATDNEPEEACEYRDRIAMRMWHDYELRHRGAEAFGELASSAPDS